MALPDANDLCIQAITGPGEICVVLPGGFSLCVQGDVEWDDVASVTKTILGQINTALTPLGPFFTVFDVLVAVFDCIKAVKEAIGPPPNPVKLVQCIENLQVAIDKLLNLHPAISIPKTIKSILTVIISFLQGIRSEMQQLINFFADIAASNLRAAQLGNAELVVVGECSSDQFDTELNNLNESIKPLSRLIGVLNLLLELAGLDCIQVPLDPLTEATEAALIPIDAAIEFMTFVRDAIPALDFDLGPIPASTDPC